MVNKVDPNEGLAADAVLATDLGDEGARQKEQLSYYGGDDDDIDIDDSADRGDNIPEDKDDGDRGDEVESKEEQKGDEEVSGEGEEGAGDAGDAEDDEGESADAADSADYEIVDEVEEEDEEEEAEETPAPKEKGIPRHRFNEINQRMRDAEAKLAKLESLKDAADKAAEDKYDFDAAEEEYMALLLDGKTKDAAAIRREIRAAEKAEFKSEAVVESTTSIHQSAMAQTVDSLTKQAEKMFPVFDESSEAFNPQAVSKTLTFMRGYQSDGMKPDDAFIAALADVIEIFGLEDTESQSNGETPKKGTKTVTKKAPISKTKEKIDASQKQGKTPAGEGRGSADIGVANIDIDNLTDDELEALPPQMLARLRGDIL